MSNFDRQIIEQIPRLRRYARALSGDSEQADDLVQDCLARGLSRIRLWRRGSDLRAWLFTIMHNLYVNQVRRGCNAPPFVVLDEARDPQAVNSTLEDDLLLRDLQSALGRLPLEQREVLLLVALEGMRYKEVSAVLDIPLGTVMSRLHRGREQLRQWMAGEKDHGLRRVK